tara:strand:- start:229 stop:348 length:120 start_codon:yes stop_codon:yes gene_type:complete
MAAHKHSATLYVGLQNAPAPMAETIRQDAPLCAAPAMFY